MEGFPFDEYRMGALTVEHNYHEPQRTTIRTLMESHGYKYVHTSDRDDFYTLADTEVSAHPTIPSSRHATAIPWSGACDSVDDQRLAALAGDSWRR